MDCVESSVIKITQRESVLNDEHGRAFKVITLDVVSLDHQKNPVESEIKFFTDDLSLKIKKESD